MCEDLQIVGTYVQENSEATVRDVVQTLCLRCTSLETCSHVSDSEYDALVDDVPIISPSSQPQAT